MRAAVTFCIFLAALMAENWIFEVNPMNEKLQAVLPAAIEDQKAICEHMKNRAKTRAGICEEQADPASRKIWQDKLKESEVQHWQSLRVLMLLEAIERDTGDLTLKTPEQGVA